MTSYVPTDSLSHSEWVNRSAIHRARAQRYTLATKKRRDHGTPHPIDDFLFQYYPYSFGRLEHWQPGYGVRLEWPDSENSPHPSQFPDRDYSLCDGYLFVDPSKLTSKERERLRWMAELLTRTRDRAPNFSCYGMHEWAMVYRGKEIRHEKTAPLRLSQAEIDVVVESRPICCSHHDAFRFFAAEAHVMNRLQPTLENRAELEQAGCVHANMDLYKWSAKSLPWVSTERVLDCFELAVKLRDLDMRASPYDLSAWNREPIRIETVEGRRIYEIEQRRLAASAAVLRERLILDLQKVLNAPI